MLCSNGNFFVAGLSLDIFQCLHESYAISLEGFLAWEKSDKELEGKGKN